MKRRRRKNPGGGVLVGVGVLALGGLGYYLWKRGVFAGAAPTLLRTAPSLAITPSTMTNQQGKQVTDLFSVGAGLAPPPAGYDVPTTTPATWTTVTDSLSPPARSFQQVLDAGVRAPRYGRPAALIPSLIAAAAPPE
jgi:hypothetical protein